MSLCLFVGGPADGRRLEVPKFVREWYVPVPTKAVLPKGFFRTVQYVAQYWHAGEKECRVFAPAELGPADVMQRLLAGYQAPPAAEERPVLPKKPRFTFDAAGRVVGA